MEGVCLSFLWISPDVVASVVWSQAFECVTNSLFHLLKGLLLCCNAHIISVVVWTEQAGQFAYVEQQGGEDAALWKAILLSVPYVAFVDEVRINVCLIACSGSVL